jgi:hypothetical protein
VILHHIALCTPCITHINVVHLLHIRVDHKEPESEFQAKQVRWVLGVPQAPSVMDANIAFRSRQVPVYLTTILEFYL